MHSLYQSHARRCLRNDTTKGRFGGVRNFTHFIYEKKIVACSRMGVRSIRGNRSMLLPKQAVGARGHSCLGTQLEDGGQLTYHLRRVSGLVILLRWERFG